MIEQVPIAKVEQVRHEMQSNGHIVCGQNIVQMSKGFDGDGLGQLQRNSCPMPFDKGAREETLEIIRMSAEQVTVHRDQFLVVQVQFHVAGLGHCRHLGLIVQSTEAKRKGNIDLRLGTQPVDLQVR